MGGCAAKNKDPTTLAIEEQLKEDKKNAENELKVLLLGTGESGKSTIAKQFRIINTGDFTVDELRDYRVFVHDNSINSMKSLVQAVESMGLGFSSPNATQLVQKVKDLTAKDELNEDLGEVFVKLWADKAVQQAYQRRSEYQLNDNCQYCMENLDRIAKADYIPTQTDVVHCRVKTTGVIETPFLLGKRKVRLVDVGGQRAERRKWMGCFDGVTAVIFCLALSEYDLKLAEDNSTNRMKESFKIFEELVNRYFPETTIVVFLNKSDLFQEKITKVPLSICFPEYTGKNEFQPAAEYIRERLISLDKNDPDRIFPHVTCATDTEQVRFVFSVIKDTLLSANLKKMGL
eukprot:TRINITY_DN8153_c0_g1_i2.p1 TRINITY_DN8153_c0_g1~~TRINITY_DN8153_c0_g1_i2.p1  ORF type:complete len:346 (-),score=98.98 TRINITY_DN8153_c0_g1_i2:201-1238(-)